MPDTTEMNIIAEEELVDTPTYRAVMAVFENPANDAIPLKEKAMMVSNRVGIVYKHSTEGKIVLGLREKITKISVALGAAITVAILARIDIIILTIQNWGLHK